MTRPEVCESIGMTNTLRRARLALLALILLPVGAAMAAAPGLESLPSAVPAGVSISLPWQAWAGIGLAALGGLVAILHAIVVFLRVEAPLTKTLADDKAKAFFEELDKLAEGWFLAFREIAGPSTAVPVKKPPAIPIGGKVGGGSVLLALLIGGLALQPACAAAKAVPKVAGHALVECGKQDLPGILAVGIQLGVQALQSALKLGHVDWPGLEESAWAHGQTIGGCAFNEFVAKMESAQPVNNGVLAAPDPAGDALARLSARFGGVEWVPVGEAR